MIGFVAIICYTSVLGELDLVSKRKILLADDSITIQKVVNLTFAEEGVEVVTVGDGDSALARIAEEWPDLVMADVNMPGANGYKVCESIRSDQATRDIPVILLVGSFEPFDEAEAERVGANAFLTKPFQSIRQLVSQVNDLMATRSAAVDDASPDVEPEISGGGDDEGDNVESLYEESLSGTETHDLAVDADLGDQGFDDEMIETSVAEEETPADTLEFGLAAEPAPVEEIAETDAFESETNFEAETFTEPAEVQEQPEFSENSFQVVEEAEQTAASADADPLEVEAAGTGNLTSEKIREAEGRTYADPFLETVRLDETPLSVPYQQPQAETPVASVTEPAASSLDLNLLDLPPVGADTLQIVTEEEAKAAGHPQTVSLSPELMEMIVQKVVEKLREGR